jgi:hypothetical protein
MAAIRAATEKLTRMIFKLHAAPNYLEISDHRPDAPKASDEE